MDRGGDRRKPFALFLERRMEFMVRLEGDGHLVYRGRDVLAEDTAASRRMLYWERVIKEETSGEKVHNIEVGFRECDCLAGRSNSDWW